MKFLAPAFLAVLLLAGCTLNTDIANNAAVNNTVEDSPAGNSAAENNVAENSAAENSAAEDSAAENSAAEDSTAEEGSDTAVLSFSSFDGGGHEYSAEIGDTSILSYESERDYGKRDELEDGSPYRHIFTFTGLKPGTTTVAIYGRSPITDNDDSLYKAVVDEKLNVTLESVRKISTLFLYRNGEMYYNSYKISHWQDGYHVSVNDDDDQYIDEEVVDALMQVIDEYDVASWDGFNKSVDHVLDGEGFWLEVTLMDGTSILARGDNAFPDNYFPAISKMQEILDTAEITSYVTTEEP